VIVNLAATDRTREWPAESASNFIAEVLERHGGVGVVIPAPPGKEEEPRAVARRSKSDRVVVAATLSLPELVALIARAEIVVTPDTGVLHLASVAGRPVVALYTPRSVHVERWLPWRVPYRAVLAPPGTVVGDIRPEDIVAAFEELYAAVGLAVPPTPTSLQV
jgi:ADP-heptose:LPS heptosyltransferase